MTDTTTDATTDTDATTTTDDTSSSSSTTTDTTTDTGADVEHWKKLARKHEDRAKQNAAAAKELETLKQSSMSDTEKAVAQARAEARTEAMREVGTRLAESAIRVAAAGRNVDVDALLEGIDAARFLDDEGEPNTKAIAAWIDRVAPAADESDQQQTASLKRDLGLGTRGGQPNAALNGDPLLRDLKAKLGI